MQKSMKIESMSAAELPAAIVLAIAFAASGCSGTSGPGDGDGGEDLLDAPDGNDGGDIDLTIDPGVEPDLPEKGEPEADTYDAEDVPAQDPVDAVEDFPGDPDAEGPGPTCPDTLATSPAADGPAGLMIQTCSAGDLCLLERSLEHICRAHRSGAGIIHDIVLTDAVRGGPSGPTEDLNTDVIDLVLRYRPCYDNLFIGTIPETILADPYDPSTIENEARRWEWLLAARRVASQLVTHMDAAAPGYPWTWYISYEANLDYFTSATYRAAYEALMLQHTQDLADRHASSSAIMWSPTFWDDYDALSGPQVDSLRTALSGFFSSVPAITWVVIQDHVGVSAAFSCSDAVSYLNLVGAAAPDLASLQINMEYFDMTSGPIVPGDPTELAARLACYRTAGAPVGASFEFRYWYEIHGH
jgi:hypothetical protein